MAKLPFRADPRVVRTAGETFADGSALELVTSRCSGGLVLLLWNANRKTIAPQVEHSGRIYQPLNLDQSTCRAIRFPRNAKGYGSTGKLLCRIRDLFERYVGLAQPESMLMTAWTASSWFADCLSSPPTLLISGPDNGDAITLFRLMHCLCRRPVVLGDLSRTAFFSLASLGTTLLINQSSLPAKVRDLWKTSNYRGVHVFGNGTLHSVASAKAVFLGMADARRDEGIHFALPPTYCHLPPLDERQEWEIAEELQPQLLMYRLRNFDRMRTVSAREHGSTSADTEVARNLATSVLGDGKIVKSLAPVLRHLEEDSVAQRGCDVHRAMIEVTWAAAHQDREISLSRIAELTNTLLRCRGEILEYSAAEIGWKFRNLGFRRHRNGRGMVLRFSQENRLLLHQLALRWSLNLPAAAGCALCSAREDIVSQRPV